MDKGPTDHWLCHVYICLTVCSGEDKARFVISNRRYYKSAPPSLQLDCHHQSITGNTSQWKLSPGVNYTPFPAAKDSLSTSVCFYQHGANFYGSMPEGAFMSQNSTRWSSKTSVNRGKIRGRISGWSVRRGQWEEMIGKFRYQPSMIRFSADPKMA